MVIARHVLLGGVLRDDMFFCRITLRQSNQNQSTQPVLLFSGTGSFRHVIPGGLLIGQLRQLIPIALYPRLKPLLLSTFTGRDYPKLLSFSIAAGKSLWRFQGWPLCGICGL